MKYTYLNREGQTDLRSIMHIVQACCYLLYNILTNTFSLKKVKPVTLHLPMNVAVRLLAPGSGRQSGWCDLDSARFPLEGGRVLLLLLVVGVQGSFVSFLSSLGVATEAAYGSLISHKPASLSTSRPQKSLLADTFLPFY